MPQDTSYAQERATQVVLNTREVLKRLPEVCVDYIRSIELRTQPLTRYAYACDLKMFFEYLHSEHPHFAGIDTISVKPKDIEILTQRDISLYMEYLSLYYKDDSVITNAEASRMRKLSTLRTFYTYMYKNHLIESDVSKIIDMPRRHEKPIIRMEIDEVIGMLDAVDSGDALGQRGKKYNEHTRLRDSAILTLFLGTGIRVSELVGIDIDDIDFNVNGFLVTRKGGSQADLYFSDEVADVLKEYIDYRRKIVALPGNENALFLSLQKKRISVRAIEIMVKKYATIAAPLKKRLSPHKLRSTFGTNLYHETGDIYLVADVLGHKDVNTTRRHYAAMLDDRRRMAAKSVKIRDDNSDKNDD